MCNLTRIFFKKESAKGWKNRDTLYVQIHDWVTSLKCAVHWTMNECLNEKYMHSGIVSWLYIELQEQRVFIELQKWGVFFITTSIWYPVSWACNTSIWESGKKKTQLAKMSEFYLWLWQLGILF